MSEQEKMLNEAKKNYDDFMRAVKEAKALASREGIKANSIIINENFVKIGEKEKFRVGLHEIRPMICGLNVFLDEGFLPEDYSFAVVDVKELRDINEMKKRLLKNLLLSFFDAVYEKVCEKDKFMLRREEIPRARRDSLFFYSTDICNMAAEIKHEFLEKIDLEFGEIEKALVEEKDTAAGKDSIYKKQLEQLKEKFLEEETDGK